MIKTIYVPQIQQAKELLDQQNWETEYSISSQASPKVKSQNKIILYALCLHLFEEVERDHYIQIDNSNFLEIRDEDRQKAIYFMNRAVSKSLPQITHKLEGKLLMQYLREQNKIYDIKMLLIIEQNLDSTTPLKNQKLYAVIYFHYQQTESIIENFCIHKIPINDELMKRKIQFLGLNNQDALNQSTMAIWQERRVNHKIIQYSEETRNQTSSIMVSDEHDESKISLHMSSFHINFQYLVIYGDRKLVQKLMFFIRQSIQSIKHRNFQRGDPLFNNFMFAVRKLIGENYQKCRIFEINKGSLLQVLYHSSIQNIFDEKLMKYDKYKITKLNNVRLALRQPSIMGAKDTIPTLISYTDKNQGQLVIGEIGLINHLQMMNENIKESRRTDKNIKEEGKQKLKSGKQQEQKKVSSQKQKQKVKVDFMNNLEINESNYKDLLEKCEQFKMQQLMTYKIDISENIRITNRIKKCNIIYVVFETVVDLLQLQTVIDEPISLTELNKIIKEYEESFYQNPKSLYIQSANLTLNLYPLPYQMMQNKEKYYKQLLQTIKNDVVIFKTLLCSLKTFKDIMRACLIDSNYIFVLNQMTPLIECDEQFEKQTYNNRIRTGKQQLQYYYQIKTDIINVDYISAANLKKQQTFLKQVMSKDIHQYEIGEYILNEADQYNISYMIAQGLQNMFFILSSSPKQQYIYFTFFQKLVKVIRDATGKFKQIQDASMSKDISRNNQQIIRPVINRAFLTGQKFISINIPIDHVKSVSLNNITRLSTGNHNLVRYYLRKLSSSQRYKICIKSPYNSEYIQKEFAKQYILKFDNQKIRKQIKSLDLGYGNIKKWREKPFVCMRADYAICKKILDKFQSDYGSQLAKQKA